MGCVAGVTRVSGVARGDSALRSPCNPLVVKVSGDFFEVAGFGTSPSAQVLFLGSVVEVVWHISACGAVASASTTNAAASCLIAIFDSSSNGAFPLDTGISRTGLTSHPQGR